MGIVANLQVQIGGSSFHGDAQQVINIHSTLPPDNLPYDDAKSHWAQDDLSNEQGRARGKPFGPDAPVPANPCHPVRSRGTCFWPKATAAQATAGLSTP